MPAEVSVLIITKIMSKLITEVILPSFLLYEGWGEIFNPFTVLGIILIFLSIIHVGKRSMTFNWQMYFLY